MAFVIPAGPVAVVQGGLAMPVELTAQGGAYSATALLVGWVCSGVLAAYLLRRRGHEFGPAAVLGFVFGPLFIPLAVDAVRHREGEVGPVHLSPGVPAGGPVDVLIGLDGGADSVALARTAVQLLGPRIGRLTLARAVDFESAGRHDWFDAKAEAALDLELTSVLLPDHAPSTVLLPGDPRKALVAHAAADGYDLVVVVASRQWRRICSGHAGRNRSGVPVLLVDAAARR